MRLFQQVILRQLRAEPLRSVITVLGIAAGIAVVLAVRLTNASAVRGFEAALELTSGRAGLEIVGAAFGIDERRLRELQWLDGYGVTSPVIDGDLVVRVPTAPLRGERAGKSAGRTELVRVLGVDILRDYALRDYDVGEVGGSAPTPTTAIDILALLTDPDAAVTTRAFADRHHLRVGDPLSVIVGDRPRTLRVRGLLEAEGPAKLLDGNFLLMDIAAAQWAFGRLGTIDRLDLRLHDDVDIDTAERAIAARLPAGLMVQRPARRGQQVEQMLAAFHLNLTALSAIALLVGLFLVYNAVSVSVLARRTEIGTLRAVGVTRRQVQGLFLGEAAVLGGLGVVVGVPLARILADATGALTARTVSTLYVATAAAPVALGPGDVVLATLIGVPLSLVAAWLPAREAAAVPPLAVLRGADQAATLRTSRGGRLWTALALLIASVASSRLPLVDGLPVAGYLASITLVFGAALLIPTALAAAAGHGRTAWFRVFGVGGWLAHAALGGAIRRVAVSVAALSVSLAMMVAITVMISSFRQTVIDWVGQSLKADLFVGPASRRAGARQPTVAPEVEAAVRSHPAVEAVDAFRSVSVPYADSLIYLSAGDFDVQSRLGGLRLKAARGGETSATALAAVLGAAKDRDALVVSEPFSIRYGKQVGDRVTLATPSGPATFVVDAVYYDYSSDRGIVTMDLGTFERFFGRQSPTGLAVYLTDVARPEAVRADLLRDLEASAGIFIFTNRSLRQEVLNIFDSTFAITYALQAIAIVVALLGVVGTLVTLVIERRRELAILRTIGAAPAQVRAMVVAEAAMLGAVSQAAGVGIGLLLALILIYVVNVQSFGWTIHLSIPWAALAQMSVVVVVATLCAGLYPAARALRAPVALLEDE
ncbi:MAG TPA: FtsX-like permease family protein [Luteitalea sp.]|nr:FtsX-like permease family protein [Luteitalea sp.]